MVIKIKKLNENAVIPKLATIGSACVDLVAVEVISEHGLADVKLGFATEIPPNYKCCIAPRSSFTQSGWVMQNTPAQIDSDYRGEWMLKFERIDYDSICPFPYNVGDRVAQCWLEKVLHVEFVEVNELHNTDRGIGGFGSTGK